MLPPHATRPAAHGVPINSARQRCCWGILKENRRKLGQGGTILPQRIRHKQARQQCPLLSQPRQLLPSVQVATANQCTQAFNALVPRQQWVHQQQVHLHLHGGADEPETTAQYRTYYYAPDRSISTLLTQPCANEAHTNMVQWSLQCVPVLQTKNGGELSTL
jgi:hypothetical protein